MDERSRILHSTSSAGHEARAGAKLAFLPPYSPDLNPIEQVFAKVKHWMRMAQERTIEAIHDRIVKLVAAIPDAECASYVRNTGYASS